MSDQKTKWGSMLTTQSIFDRYEEVRARFPDVSALEASLSIRSLLDIADQVDAFVFDAFGVLNVGETMIPGADIRLDQLRARGCAIRILTNAASFDTQKCRDFDVEMVEDRATFECPCAAKLIVGLIGKRIRQVCGMHRPCLGATDKELVAFITRKGYRG